jgi:hypothetical protein
MPASRATCASCSISSARCKARPRRPRWRTLRCARLGSAHRPRWLPCSPACPWTGSTTATARATLTSRACGFATCPSRRTGWRIRMTSRPSSTCWTGPRAATSRWCPTAAAAACAAASNRQSAAVMPARFRWTWNGCSRVLEVDRTSRAARIQAGALGPELEAQLKPHGLTLAALSRRASSSPRWAAGLPRAPVATTRCSTPTSTTSWKTLAWSRRPARCRRAACPAPGPARRRTGWCWARRARWA